MKVKIFNSVFFIFFLSFFVSYILSINGYYEYKLQDRVIMTNNEISRFEKDILDGKDVKKEDYVVDSYKDYSSKLTNTTADISIKFNKILKKGIEGVFKIASVLVEE